MSYSKSDIPDFLENVGAQLTDAEQRIDTDILEPVIFSDTFLRFQLQNKGILNPKSRITFSYNSPSKDSFLPLGTGIKSLIQRARLVIGGKTICEVDDWAHYDFYKSLFIDQQVIKEREQYMSGHAMSNAVVYNDGTNTSEFVGMDLGKEFVVDTTTATDTNMTLQTFQKLNSEPVFSITLDALIPCLRNQQLPLFMLKEDIAIELTLASTVGKRAVFEESLHADKDTAITLNQNDVRMIADYTFLDGDAMNSYAKQYSSMSYTFLEPRLTKTTLSSATDWNDQVRNVGGAGRRVPKMFVMLTSDKMGKDGGDTGTQTEGHNQLTLLNDYRAVAPLSGNESNAVYGTFTANVKKNDEFIFPIDRSNSALHYHGVQQTEGMPPQVTRGMYARHGNSLVQKKFEGYTISQQEQLNGQFFVTAFRFPDGQRVDSKGLETHFKYSDLATTTAPYTQRVYIEVEKTVNIEDGIVTVDFQ